MSGRDNNQPDIAPPDRHTIDDDRAARLMLQDLQQVGQARLAWLLSEGPPLEAVEAIRAGRWPVVDRQPPPGVDRSLLDCWKADLRQAQDTLAADHKRYRELGVSFLTPSDPLWPFPSDPAPPLIVLARGNVELLGPDPAQRVAVVGTRRCTSVGRTVAHQLGAGLADAGCMVVSGLALGVDGAAHRGALERAGAVIGVVGTGLDVPYPKSNRQLWDEVTDSGLLMSEYPIRARPARWRFPARNRLIAGLSAGVVVVESHKVGGALSTVDEAANRGLSVMAVPGSVLSPASDGTNALLIDGAVPVRDADDVVGYLGLEHPATAADRSAADGTVMASCAPASADPVAADASSSHPNGGGEAQVLPFPVSPPPPTSVRHAIRSPGDAFEQLVLAEVAAGSVHVDRLVAISGLPVVKVVARLEALRAEGLVTVEGSTVSLPTS